MLQMNKYLLVSFSLLTGSMALSTSGNAFTIANGTGADITVTQKGAKAIVLKNEEKTPELKNIPTAIAGGKDAGKLKALKIKKVSKDAGVITIVKENDKLAIKASVKAK